MSEITFSSQGYLDFLACFARNGYCLRPLSTDIQTHKFVYLRHDVDYDVDYALEMARLENRNGVCSTYFFLLCSGFYNLQNPKVHEKIRSIQSMGHLVGLHFDPMLYSVPQVALQKELSTFNSMFAPTDLFSFHRPVGDIIGTEQPFAGVEHTYILKA